MSDRRRILSFDVGLRHLAFAEVDLPARASALEQAVLLRWEVVDVLDGRSATRATFQDSVESVLRALDERFPDGCDTVLIENQPSSLNPRLKSVQTAMYAYFKTMDLHTALFPDVRLLPASGKLQGLRRAPPGLVPPRASSMSYAQKKRAAVVACEHYLRHVFRAPARADAFAAAGGKRDDLADCLLQAAAFIERTCETPATTSTAAPSTPCAG